MTRVPHPILSTSSGVISRKNSILAPYRTLPLEIECSEDEDWDEYLDMMSMQISDED